MARNSVQYSYNLGPAAAMVRIGAEPVPLSSIPANIRHQFGDADCERLLSDPRLVSTAWQRTQRSAKRYKNPHVYYQDRPASPRAEPRPEELPYGTVLLRNTYQDMSRIARNAFPGHNMTYATGHTGSVHSHQVLDRADPVPGQHKVIMDDFSDYNQRVYVGIVANREWKRMKMEKPQVVDWAAKQTKAPPLPAKPSQPPALKKPDPEVAPSVPPVEKKVTIMDGPPPPYESVAARASPPKDSLHKPNAAKPPDFQRDEEFWDMYKSPITDANAKKP